MIAFLLECKLPQKQIDKLHKASRDVMVSPAPLRRDLLSWQMHLFFVCLFKNRVRIHCHDRMILKRCDNDGHTEKRPKFSTMCDYLNL